MIRKNCKCCGRFIYPSNQQIKKNQGKFCSISCSNKFNNPMKADPAKKVTKECGVCGEKFTRYKSSVDRYELRYCSRKCGGIARRGKYEPANKKQIPDCYCDYCGEKIPRDKAAMKISQLNTMDKNHMFCDIRCCSEFQKNRVERTCIECGSIFEITKSGLKQGKGYYCSMKCLSKHKRDIRACKNCNKKFEVCQSSPQEYCSQECHYNDRTLYHKTAKLRILVKERQRIRSLDDHYMKSVINSATGIPFKDIPKELIELKRLNIKRKRKLKEITHGNSH